MNTESRGLLIINQRNSFRQLLGTKPWVLIPAAKIGIPLREFIILAASFADIPCTNTEQVVVWTVEEAVHLQTLIDERRVDAHEYKRKWGGTYLAGDEFKKARQELARLFK